MKYINSKKKQKSSFYQPAKKKQCPSYFVLRNSLSILSEDLQTTLLLLTTSKDFELDATLNFNS